MRLVALLLAAAPLPARAGDLALQFGGFVQAEAGLFDQASEDELDPATRAPLNTEQLSIRRARARVEARKDHVSAVLELEWGTRRSDLQLYAAEAMYRFGDPLVLGLGITRIPFGFETRQPELVRLFLEQPSANRALFPGSMQLALRARGEWRVLRYDVAVLSGEPRKAASFALQAPSHSVDFAGRLGLEAEVAPGVVLSAGFSGLEGNGFHAGTPTTKDQLTWRDANGDGLVQLPELEVIPGTSAEPSTLFRRFALGADAHANARLPFARLVATVEAIWSKNLDRALYVSDPVGAGRDQRGKAFTASAALEELPWGFSAGVRYDRYDPDADASDAEGAVRVPFDATVSTVAFAASVRIEQAMRLTVEYDLNHNAFGRGANGAPASLAADALTARVEVAF